MDILSHIEDSKKTSELIEIMNQKIGDLVSPITYNPSAKSYAEFIESIGLYIHSAAKDIILETIKKMDDYFFELKGRSKSYYSKGYRKREIVTVFGHIIYYRHEYINRLNNKPFIYVDEKLGLRRRDRYDPTVCSLIYEKYAYTNSMTNVGKDIGVSFDTPFSLDENRLLNSIPRQTVWKILHRFKSIEPVIEEVKETPEILYVMADEKYIPSQFNDGKKLMSKEVIVHEGVKEVIKKENKETGEVYTRKELINPHRFINHNEDIYHRVSEYISSIYNTSKIKQIYLMGDGGSWIKEGLDELNSVEYKIDYGLDKFHFCQAVNNITDDDIYKNLIYYYSIKNMKDDFNYLIKLIIKNSKEREEIIVDKAKYIRNHFKEIRTMYKYIKIGCAMEQAISHDIMSIFTSIPKAYSKNWLTYYLNERENYLNGYDLRKLYIEGLDRLNIDSEDEGNNISLKPHLDFSFFDNQIKEETYTLNKAIMINLSRNRHK